MREACLLEQHQDPRTQDTDKYFLGDRFHEKTVIFLSIFLLCNIHNFQYPHSSELCRYHDINLGKELSAAKTSSQEVLNSTRNWRRLRYSNSHVLIHLFISDQDDVHAKCRNPCSLQLGGDGPSTQQAPGIQTSRGPWG